MGCEWESTIVLMLHCGVGGACRNRMHPNLVAGASRPHFHGAEPSKAPRVVRRSPPRKTGRDEMGKRTLDTGTKDLLAHVDDGVAVITMNRPERRNAMSSGMLNAMSAVLGACETDPDVACIVLTGAGGAFCAGGDVKGMADGTGGGSTAAAGMDLDSRIH